MVANAVFATRPIEALDHWGNVSAPLAKAGDYLRHPLLPPGELDLRPIKALTASFDVTQLQDYLDWNQDFDGNFRHAEEVGAYSGAGAAGGYWPPRVELKPDSILPH